MLISIGYLVTVGLVTIHIWTDTFIGLPVWLLIWNHKNILSAVKNKSPNKSRSIFFKKISSNFIFTSSVCEENVHTVRCIPSRTPPGIYESIKSRSNPPVSISSHHNKLLVKAHSHSADIDFGLSNTVITAYYSHCDGLWGGRPVAENLSLCCQCQ